LLPLGMLITGVAAAFVPPAAILAAGAVVTAGPFIVLFSEPSFGRSTNVSPTSSWSRAWQQAAGTAECATVGSTPRARRTTLPEVELRAGYPDGSPPAGPG